VSIPVIFIIIKKEISNKEEKEKFEKKFGSLIEGQRAYEGIVAAYWKFLTLIRWTITTSILIFLKDQN
jgi:hypothetical protein